MNRLVSITHYVFLVLVISAVSACGSKSSSSSDEVLSNESGKLVSSKKVAGYSQNTVQLGSGIETKYAVEAYRIVYETKGTDGKFLKASGLVTIPQKRDLAKSPTILFHHGTTYESKYVPSENPKAEASSVLPGFIGFIVVAPDYIGYGESLGVMHPYLNAKVTASTSIDLLRATQTFLKEKNIASNDQLFLGGYSQGGSAAIASQKLLEEELTDEFTVTASSVGAGPYNLSLDLKDTSNYILQNFDTQLISRPSNLGLITKAMDDAYGLNIVNRMFQLEYAKIVGSIYDGSNSVGYIEQKLTRQASKLLNKDFLERLVNGQEKAVTEAFEKNDVFDWSPRAPTRLFHGRDDDWVSFKHSQTAYDAMVAKNASVELVDCVVDQGFLTNHRNCFTPYLFFTYDFFLEYAKDL